jgi:glycosyltransferase involved in cell wall biosynthesis
VRVLHVLAPAEAGGLERVVQSLAAGLQAHGEEHHVAAVLDRPVEHPMFAPLRAAGVTVHPLLIPARAYRVERTAIESLCRQIDPYVVHTHGYRADVVDAPVARRLGIRTVSTVHGFTGGGWRNRAYELLQRIALRQFDLVVAVARPLAVHLARVGVPATRIRIVPNAWCPDQVPLNGQHARATLGVPRDRFHLGWVGRLSWENGADILLEAVARLKDLPMAVSVLGGGAERRTLEALARRLGIGSLVTWWGTVPAASRFFPGFDAFVISSRTEGTPIVLFEAMRSGVPVVAAAVGGVPDVVSDNEAMLVPPRDPAALANALRGLYHAPHLAALRAARARGRLSEHDEAPWLQHYHALYHSLWQPSRVVFSQEVVGMPPTALAGFPGGSSSRPREWLVTGASSVVGTIPR